MHFFTHEATWSSLHASVKHLSHSICLRFSSKEKRFSLHNPAWHLISWCLVMSASWSCVRSLDSISKMFVHVKLSMNFYWMYVFVCRSWLPVYVFDSHNRFTTINNFFKSLQLKNNQILDFEICTEINYFVYNLKAVL